jgi:hypothetical protein
MLKRPEAFRSFFPMADTLSVQLEVLDDGATAKFTNFERRAEQTASAITGAGKRANFSKGVKSDLEIAERKIEQFAQKFDRIGLGDFGKGALVAGAAIGGLSLGVAKFIDLSRQAIEISIRSERANRLLAASATEAGLAYADLAEKNRKFAELNGLSNVGAATTTARIAQLARAGGRPQDIDKLLTSFSDLSAARGLNPRDLETIIQQIQSGQDEGLNKLGLPDPSVIYRKYAQEIGKTADALTQFEKVQAATNAVVEKSEIFKGAAQARMQSLEGVTASLTARWDNLTTSFANSFAQSREVGQSINALSGFVKQLTYDSDALQKKLSLGFSPAQLAKETAASFKTFDEIKAAFARTTDPLGIVFDPLSSNGTTENSLREDEILRRLNAQKLADALQKKSADEQKQILDDLIKKNQAIEQSQQRQTELQRVLANPRTSLAELRQKRGELQNDFFNRESALSAADKLKLADDFDKAVSQGVQKGFARSLRSTESVSELKKILAGIGSNTELLPDAKEDLIFNFEQKIKSAVESGKQKVLELSKTYNSVLDNLFARQGANNPFVAVFSEADRSLKALRENLKGLSPELASTFEKMQERQNKIALFNARLDSQLSAFDLRESAAAFRGNTPIDNGLVQKEFFNRVVRRGYNSDFGRYASGGKSFEELSDAEKLNIYEVDLLKSFPADGLNQKSLVSALARDRNLTDNPNASIQERLQKQFDIIEKLGSKSDLAETGAAADKRIIALTQGVDPSSLTTDQRVRAAAAREREADRTIKAEAEAAKAHKESLDASNRLADEIKKLRELAEKEGLQAVINIVNKTGDEISVTKSPNPADTAAYFSNF